MVIAFNTVCKSCGERVTWPSDDPDCVEVQSDAIGRVKHHWRISCACGSPVTAFGGRPLGTGEI